MNMHLNCTRIKAAGQGERQQSRCILKSQVWWITPVILANWEAEIRRIIAEAAGREPDPTSKITRAKRSTAQNSRVQGPEFKLQYCQPQQQQERPWKYQF
jgi:hypothetical protein